MNKKILVILLAVALAMSAAAIGTAAAKTTTQSIEFTLEGWGESYDPVTDTWISVPVSAVLDGNIKDKDGTYYLSPQTGTITIDGVEHQIQVKQAKQSEPVFYDEDSWCYYWNPCDNYCYEWENWMTIGEINIEGRKYIGNLNWYQDHYWGTDWWTCEPYEYYWDGSYLYFQGIVDGKMMSFWLNGDFPVIDS